MTAKTILDRGLTSFASQPPTSADPEHFSLETRKIELLAYFKYCVERSLLLTDGEQSRKLLIRKAFNHKGGAGSSWREAMKNWLLSELDPDPSDISLGNLWLSYFEKHRTVADSQGVTYNGLSVEAAYRKFLYEHLALAENYYDQLILSDQLRTKLSSVFSGDEVTIADTVQIYLDQIEGYNDFITMDSAVVISQNKTLIDALNQTDSHYVSVSKKFSDNFQILDAFQIAGAASDAYQSLCNLKDSAKLKVSKVFDADTIAASDSHALLQNMKVVDSVSFSDSIEFIIGAFHIEYDDVEIEEQALILVMHNFNDTYTIEDESYYGNVLFNGGTFGEYVFGA